MDLEKQFLKDLDSVLSKERKNKTCLYPGCGAAPINSHVIARKTLKLIAENSHVLTWLPPHISPWKIAKATVAGVPEEQLYGELQSIGIGEVNKVTKPMFCSSHDNRLFGPLERMEFSFQPEQVLLLAYRVLGFASLRMPTMSVMDNFSDVMKKYNHEIGAEKYARMQGFLTEDWVRKIYQRYEQIRDAHDYSQLGYSIYLVNMPPCIAAFNGFVYAFGFDEVQAIADDTQAITAEDFMSFTFLPYETSNQSICVISWLKDSWRAQRFLLSSRINELSEEKRQELLLSLAFASTIYISPAWWSSLSREKREEFKRIHLNETRKSVALFC